MSQESKPQSIADRQRNSEAEAALEQMFGYFSREGQTHRVISEFDAYRAAGRAA
ncbi:hypothetical protein [Paracoccus alkanivorans]|uniref:hypothetical protein n=1 Tax=Paracoccus alkanivorans TaxID=2116655 RepID=UPI0014096140|nr:hypothetical protein [Paracoccus alkanivorans]